MGVWAAVLAGSLACAGPALAPAGGPDLPVRGTTACTVSRIVDGDTVQCDPVGRVRLLGIDTPERGQPPFGREATEALARLAPVGSLLLAEADVEDRDRYDRALRYLWLPGEGEEPPRMLNWLLVRQGYALVLTYPPNVQYVEALTRAQEAAREEGAGLWAVDGFACTPRDHRAGRCGG